MSVKNIKAYFLGMLFVLIAMPGISWASDYYWFDGDRRLELRPVPELAVDFRGDRWHPSARQMRLITSVKEAYPGVLLYQLDPDLSATQQAVLFNPPSAFSPVFEDSGGLLKALPGEVTVIFKQGMSQKTIRTFWGTIEGINVEDVKPLGWHPQGYILQAAPGLAALNLANSLVGHPGIALVAPNWWRSGVGNLD